LNYWVIINSEFNCHCELFSVLIVKVIQLTEYYNVITHRSRSCYKYHPPFCCLQCYYW